MTPGELAFLDVLIINDKTGNYKFKVFRKDAITNVQIKPNSSINPAVVKGVFKGFIARAKRICSQEFLDQEIEFLIEMFAQNGYDRTELKNIVANYDVNASTSDHDTSKPVVRIPWIPVVGPKLRKALRKHGCSVVFSSGRSLKDILCNHKTPLPKNSKPGIYSLECGCSSVYVGETKKCVSTRIGEHERDIFKGKWTVSGASEHAKQCQHNFKFDEAATLSTEPNYRRRKVREAVEIRRVRRSNLDCTNRDNGTMMRTSQWDYLLGRV